MRRNVAGFDRNQAVTLIDRMPVISLPVQKICGPLGALDGDQTVILALGPVNDVPGWDAEGGEFSPGPGCRDGEIADARNVGNSFVEAGASFGSEIVYCFHVDAKAADQLEAAKFLPDVLGAPVGIRAAAMRGAYGYQGVEVFGHVEAGEHESGIESAHGMGNQYCAASTELRHKGENPFSELAGAGFDAGGGMDGGDENRVTGAGDGAIDAFEG
jgi:hypothetical protein